MLKMHPAGANEFQWDTITYKQNLPYLTHFLSTLLRGIGRVERKVATARYIEGLLLPGRGKFIRPLAERLGVDSQSLQQALANGKWNPSMLWSTLRTDLLPLVEPFPQWYISERIWLKQGNATVGVANQRAGSRGKSTHCQVSVEVLGTDGSFAVPLASRLYLPEEWASNAERRHGSEVPDNLVYLSKPSLALTLIKEALRDGMHPGIIQGDRMYGNDREFRVSLAQQTLEFFLEVDGDKVMAWDFNSQTTPVSGSLQPTTLTLNEIAKGIESSEWVRGSYTNEAGMVRRTRIGCREIFVDPGPFNMESKIEKLMLVVDWPEDLAAPHSLHLTNLQQPRSEAHFLRLGRFHAYREHYRNYFEEQLDLASYQGRSWNGFHHHLVLATAAYLFVLILERRSKAAFWCEISNNTAVDVAIAAETQRLAGILFRHKAAEFTSRPASGTESRNTFKASQRGSF